MYVLVHLKISFIVVLSVLTLTPLILVSVSGSALVFFPSVALFLLLLYLPKDGNNAREEASEGEIRQRKYDIRRRIQECQWFFLKSKENVNFLRAPGQRLVL